MQENTQPVSGGVDSKKPQPGSRFLKKFVWLGVVILLYALIAPTYGMWPFPDPYPGASEGLNNGDRPIYPDPEKDIIFSSTDEGLDIEHAFPNLEVRSLSADPDDEDVFWLALDGGVARYDSRREQITDLFTAEDGINNPVISVVRKGDTIYFTHQGSFKELNLETRETRLYTVVEGLVNGSNLHVFDDPFDKQSLWIGTFNGLSRFDVVADTFENFTSVLGVPGSSFGINNRVFVEEDFVWVVVNANAYNRGGIAQLNRVSGEWRSWGPEAFGRTQRVDFDSVTVNNGTAYASISADRFHDIYEYDQGTDEWKNISQESDLVTHLTYLDGRLFYLNRDDLVSRDLDSQNITIIKPREVRDFLARDAYRDRLLFFEHPEVLSVFDVSSATVSESSSRVPVRPTIKDLIGGVGSKAFVLGSSGAHVYDLGRGSLEAISGLTSSDEDFSFESHLYRVAATSEGFVIPKLPLCGIGCIPGTLFMVSGTNYRVLEKYEIPEDVYADELVVDPSSDEIYLRSRDPYYENPVYRFDSDQEVFVAVEVDPFLGEDVSSELQYQFFHRDLTLTSEDGERSVRVLEFFQTGNGVRFDISEDGGETWIPKIYSVGPEIYSPFGDPPSVSVSTVTFDESDPNLLWVGTNRGLIRYDWESDQGQLLSTNNGLASNRVSHFYAQEKLIIQHPTGVYIYSVP